METLNYEPVTYEGYDCLRLANDTVEVIVTQSVGPRIVRYALHNGPNTFHLCSHLSKALPEGGEWKPYGGHRLWIAPEAFPFSYPPDNSPVSDINWNGQMLRLANPPEEGTGIAKDVEITLAPKGAAVRVVHRLTNHNNEPVTVAAWALSIVANGGRVVIPQEPFVSHDDDLLPARPLVLWKFTDMADPRWWWGAKYLSLRQTDTPDDKPQKVGLFNAQGWAAHLTDTQAFIVVIPLAGGPASLPDMGSNFEAYTDGPFQELETLGPLTTLAPGQSVTHTEDWFLASTDAAIPDTDDALDTHLLPIVARARDAFASLP